MLHGFQCTFNGILKESRLILEGIAIEVGWISVLFGMGFNVFCLPFSLLLGSPLVSILCLFVSAAPFIFLLCSTWFSRGLSYAFYWVPLWCLMGSLNSSIGFSFVFYSIPFVFLWVPFIFLWFALSFSRELGWFFKGTWKEVQMI